MIDDLKSCSVCGTRLTSKWSKGDLVHYCAYCAVAECSDNALALRETGALRARAEAAEQRAEAAEADLSALAATVGAAVVASALAPGESLSAPPQHIIVSQVNRLRARAEAAEAEAERLRTVITKAVDDLPEWSDGALKHLSPAEAMADEVRMALRAAVTR